MHPILILLTLLLLLIISAVTGQECTPGGRITGREPPPGKCNTENDSDCCVPGQNYTLYWCSPPVTNRTAAVLNLSGFGRGSDGGGPARCDNKYHSDNTPVVSLSTGWFNESNDRCGDIVLITGNGRTARAVVVDECNSHTGCDAPNDYQPPCPYNVLSASKAVWAALGVPESSDLYGEMNVTWAPTNEKAPTKNYFERNKVVIIVVVVVVVVVLVSTMVVGVVVYTNRRKRSRKDQLEEEQWENSIAFLSDMPKRFTYKELKLATGDFNEQRKLGVGGFGSVFEGTLNDSYKTRVAVKRLDYFKQGKKEFMTEVKTTGSIHHFNLVKLIGFCAEKGQRLLVYEYMSNGSLDKWIFRENGHKSCSLDWGVRRKIILHIVKGLSYLHEDCNSKIIHLDIKPQNILLDSEFNAKLADFGLAKLIDKEESFAATQMRGTRGYLAPEWLSRKITEKVDVYSCGIVMLEIVFQRRNFDVLNQDNPTLIEIVRSKLEEDRLFEVIEACCQEEEMMKNNIEEVEKMIKLAIWCIQVEPTKRPSMSTVVKVIEGAIALEPIIDPSFANTILFSETSGEISSNATIDMSSMAFPR